jgi:hypothetical protein
MSDFSTAIARNGIEVEVWRRIPTADDPFGNETETWVTNHSVITTRSYPNRNTTEEESVGDMDRDRPIFFFAPDADVVAGDRIRYNDNYYELESPTKYHTHTSMYSNAVDGFDPTN